MFLTATQSSTTYFLPHIYSIGMLLKPASSSAMIIMNMGNTFVLQPFDTVLYFQALISSQITTAQQSNTISPYLN